MEVKLLEIENCKSELKSMWCAEVRSGEELNGAIESSVISHLGLRLKAMGRATRIVVRPKKK
jgi:hypothetical protein